MKVNMLILSALLSTAALAACSKNQPPADGLSVPAAPDADAPATDASTTSTSAPPAVNPLADFTVDPGAVSVCEGRDRVVAKVKWLVKDPTVLSVKVEVNTAADPARNTFASGASIGEALTGEWVGAGARFHLSDLTTGKELATYEVTSLPCE